MRPTSHSARCPAYQPPATPDSNDPNGIPDIFIAIEKQLGLKLEKIKAELEDVLVIDHADKTPTEN